MMVGGSLAHVRVKLAQMCAFTGYLHGTLAHRLPHDERGTWWVTEKTFHPVEDDEIS